MLGLLRVKARSRKRVISFNEIEFQEILLDSLAQKQANEFGYEAQRLEVPLSIRVLFSARLAMVFMLAVILLRTIQLQIIEGDKYRILAQQNQLNETQILPERGVFYDSNMNPLVVNAPNMRLLLDKRRLPKDSAQKLAAITTMAYIIEEDPQEMLDKIEKSTVTIETITESLPHEKFLALKEKERELPGFFVEQNYRREYKDAQTFAHVLGYLGKINEKELESFADYVGTENVGRTGLEKQYEYLLHGKSGKMKNTRNASGGTLESAVATEPTAGNSLVLWINADLQNKLAGAIQNILTTTGSTGASAVAIDPRTGGILAITSLPSFNSNLFSRGIKKDEFGALQNDPAKPLFPRAFAGQYPTGSTIKPLLSAAGLQEGIISENTQIFAPLEMCLKNVYSGGKECYADWTFHGWTDIKRAIAESINPFFYILGGGYRKNEFSDSRLPDSFEGLGANRIKHYLSLFGWGEKSGLDLPGETGGRIPDPEWKKSYFTDAQDQIWYLGDTYNLSIGQGYLLATPLQVANAYAAIANGGVLYKPQLVNKLVDSKRNILEEYKPQEIRSDFIDSENLDIVKEGMRDAVLYGSSKILAALPVNAAAKTGTAQISANSDRYYNWVTVFAPYENPEIVLTVLVENVHGIQAASLPVAKNVLEWYFSK